MTCENCDKLHRAHHCATNDPPDAERSWADEVCAIAHALGVEHTPEGQGTEPGTLPDLLRAIKDLQDRADDMMYGAGLGAPDLHTRLTRIVDENLSYRPTAPIEALLDALEKELPKLRVAADPVICDAYGRELDDETKASTMPCAPEIARAAKFWGVSPDDNPPAERVVRLAWQFDEARRDGWAAREKRAIYTESRHLGMLAAGAEYALSKFGDEYEGRLGPLRAAYEAYQAWRAEVEASWRESDRKGGGGT